MALSVLDREIRAAVAKLDKYALLLKKERTAFLEYAAVPVINEAQRRAPVGVRVHYRYATAKVDRGIRAPKGMGNRVATYKPGNLRMSIQKLTLKRSQKVFVGPKVARRGGKGIFGGAKFDAYYAAYLEFGTSKMRARPFMRPAADAARPEVLRRVEQSVKFLTKKFEQQNSVR